MGDTFLLSTVNSEIFMRVLFSGNFSFVNLNPRKVAKSLSFIDAGKSYLVSNF